MSVDTRTLKAKPLPHEFKFRCSWAATGVTLIVEGKDEAHALKRCESMLKKMLGGYYCQEIKMVEQTR